MDMARRPNRPRRKLLSTDATPRFARDTSSYARLYVISQHLQKKIFIKSSARPHVQPAHCCPAALRDIVMRNTRDVRRKNMVVEEAI